MRWIAGLFACKSIEGLIAQSDAAPSTALPRTLGLFSLTCFGVGSTIGAGIFVLTGSVAAQHAGPAIVLSFLLASVACAFAGLCYAEFAAMVPVAGSAYTYAYATLGELAAWTIGWCLVVEYLLAASLVAIGWSGYAVSMAADYGVRLPPSLTQAPFDVTAAGLVPTGGLFNLPAAAVLIICTALLLLGTQVSARLNDLIVVVKVAAILIIGIAGLAFAHPSHWTPFIPPNAGSFGQFGVSGVVTGAAILFYAYIGFDAVSAMAQETRNAQRVVPMALIASLIVCAVLYILVALMVTGLADYRSLGVSDPIDVAIAAGGRGMAWAKPMVGAVVVVGLISVLLVTLLGQVRIFYAMGRDGLLPRMFIIVDPRSGTPRMGTIVTGASAAVIAGIVPLNLLDELISIGTLLAFAIVCMGVIVLRRRRPELPRPFRVPWYPWIPLAGILVCIVLMASLPWDTWVRLLVWLILGFVVYGAYGARHSVLRRAPDEDFVNRARVENERL
jgi:APA family basic amino acid/polyamine antiporter